MAFNFPDAPAEDQVFTPSGGPTYVYKAPRWLVQMAPAAAGVTTDDAAPGSPVDGQLWYKSNTGDTYIWYVDPSGVPGQWVQVNVMPATGSSPVATAQTQSRIVNGAMQIAQEQVSTTTHTGYAVDQWALQFNGGAYSLTQIVSAVAQMKSRLRLQVSTAVASPTSGNFLTMIQPVEGIRLADTRWPVVGLSVPMVLAFTAYHSIAGTFGVSIRSSTNDASYTATYVYPTPLTYQRVTIPIPVPTIGTWAQDSTKGMDVIFSFMVGTTYATAPGVWTAGNFPAPTGITNGAATVNNTFDISNVGLYLDPQNTGVAPAFQMPDEAEELRACQRYYWKVSTATGSRTAMGYANSATTALYSLSLPVPVRTTPAFSSFDQTPGYGAGAGPVFTDLSIQGIQASILVVLQGTFATGPAAGAATQLRSNSASGYMIFNSRM